ncbi:hypothetical protein EST38_g3910 [Candolleomyces aberdarensis]|uniref:Transmembrane protein n=1 Tax=Candolleomyces aberdarensis TaxID=2316362 RepID=A0A4Q2DP96_9AGAR|nr:hypothetical protein EST38_g3910 [Candolleomyces aberdarensis]
MRWALHFVLLAAAALTQKFVLAQTLGAPSTTAIVTFQTRTVAPSVSPAVPPASLATRHTPRPTRASFQPASTPSGSIKPKLGPKKSRRPVHPVIIMFSVLGGLVVLGLFIALGRCIAARKRGPKRDRIAEVMERHRLQQELAHLNRNSFFGVPAHSDPAPAYYPPPPTYDASGASVIHSTHRNGYIGLSSGSPPPGQPTPLSEARDPLNPPPWTSANEPLLAARHQRLDSSV